ncbi:hypothetical protein [Novosphingobium naphthalenivorans]|uniref:hypothetical protein n=1 Tax=Novosphingobium naphthalenivorans TaxID=273168 RepID=UPI0012EDAE63|nr:hypothetical protein [Novosphingobium naphthalenivorans]
MTYNQYNFITPNKYKRHSLLSSSSVAILYRISELTRRFGLNPSEADATFGLVKDGPEDNVGHFMLAFDSVPGEPEKAERMNQMLKLLGCNEDGELTAHNMGDIEDAIDHALSLAPRSRSI